MMETSENKKKKEISLPAVCPVYMQDKIKKYI